MIYNANLVSLIVLSIFNVVLVSICFLQLEVLKRRIKSIKEIEEELKAFFYTEVVEDIYNQVWERIKGSLTNVAEEIAKQQEGEINEISSIKI